MRQFSRPPKRGWITLFPLVLVLFLSTLSIGVNAADLEESVFRSDASHDGSSTPQEQNTPPSLPKIGPTECSNMTMPSGPVLRVCLQRSLSNPHPANILYLLHGSGGKPDDFFDPSSAYGKFARFLPALFLNAMPHVVAISYGPSESIPIEASGSKPNSVRDLLKFALPQIEASLGYGRHRGDSPKRHIVGISLGGYNALSLVSFAPSHFSSLTALCPAIWNFDFFSPAAISRFKTRNQKSIDENVFESGLAQIQAKFQNYANWQKRNPLTHLADGIYDHLNLFISIGRSDGYGFFEATNRFAVKAKARGDRVTYIPVAGGHCSFDPIGAMTFLKGRIVEHQLHEHQNREHQSNEHDHERQK